MEPSDHSLEQFVRLLTAHQPRIYALIASMVGNWSDAEDLLQDVNVALWKKFEQFTPGTNFGAWAMQFARLEVRKYYDRMHASKLKFNPELLEAIADQIQTISEQADLRFEALEKCMQKLEERSRKIVRLRYEPNATVATVADQIGVTPNVVYKSLNSIHAMLLACIRKTLALEGIR